MPSPHALYRFYDETGELLYVGISVNPGARFAQHRSDKPWWGDVVDIKVQPIPTREAALEAEREAIKNERPLHNTVHNEREDKKDPYPEVNRLMTMTDEYVIEPIVRALGGSRTAAILADDYFWGAASTHYKIYTAGVEAGEEPDPEGLAWRRANAAIAAMRDVYVPHLMFPRNSNRSELMRQADAAAFSVSVSDEDEELGDD